MDLADHERFLTSMDTVECCFPDTWGTFVGRRMPAETFLRAAREGLSMPNAAFAWNLTGDIAPTPFASADTGFPNMHVQPDLDTLRAAPWAERTAFCLMDAFEERGGAPHPMSTRAMLRRAVADLGDLGYEAWVAPELEFYLCTEDWQPVSQDHRCWSMTRGDEAEPIVGEIRAKLLAAGVPVESSQTEGGPGQLEINVGPTSALEAADNAALLKYVVKLVARRHGLRATFMPMPFQGQEGSGHHLHESLRRTGSEENVFASDDAVFEAYLSGVLEHMVDLTAVNLPGRERVQAPAGLHVRAQPRVVGPRQPQRRGADPLGRSGRAPPRDPYRVGRRQPVPDRGDHAFLGRRRHRARTRRRRSRRRATPTSTARSSACPRPSARRSIGSSRAPSAASGSGTCSWRRTRWCVGGRRRRTGST